MSRPFDVVSTHIRIASFLWDIDKQCTADQNVASDQGSHCLLLLFFYKLE